jgi:prophage regulatory protein
MKKTFNPNPEWHLDTRGVMARYCVSQTTLWRWRKNGEFPQPMILPGGVHRWRLADLKAWEAERIGSEVA